MCVILEPHQVREEKPRQDVLCDSLFSSPASERVTMFLVPTLFFSSHKHFLSNRRSNMAQI
jgi:hypothetical protein